jgi:hypothetical protein
MIRAKEVDVQEFARRVERVCDFFLSRIQEKDGSADLRVIQDLKEDAADLQFAYNEIGYTSLSGLKEYMSGAPTKEQQ